MSSVTDPRRARSRGAAPRLIAVALLAGAVLGAVAVSGEGAASAEVDGGAGSASSCVRVATEARYVPFGYNHLVNLQNGCRRTVLCSVRTDVNPAPVQAEVPASALVTVQTFAGSPAQTFTAKVDCVFR